MKRQIRVIGIDDSPFEKERGRKVLIVGAVFRGGEILDGILSTHIEKDGDDATHMISDMIIQSKFYTHLRAIFLNGIAVGGFNVVDIEKLNESTKVPVITIIRKIPDITKMKNTLLKVGLKEKIALIDKAPEIEKYGNLFFQKVGISLEDTEKLLKICIKNADIPEALRIAHMIGSGIIKGESSGQA